MKNLNSMHFSKLFSVAALFIFVAILATPAGADTKQLYFGNTTVKFDEDFVNIFNPGDGVEPIGPAYGFGFGGNTFVRFPIAAGIIDLDTNIGDIFHVGGLTLGKDAKVLRLLNFLITMTPPNVRVLSARVVTGDQVGPRISLFDLTLDDDPDVYWNSLLKIDVVDLTLTDNAASQLNIFFGGNMFQGGMDVGEATVWSWFRD